MLGLAGENGSGKSTLLSQIAGILRSDSGRMELNGAAYAPTSALEANQSRIAMVVQELGTVTCLPVASNIFLGRMKQFTRGGLVNFKQMAQEIHSLTQRWGLPEIDAQAEMGQMDVESRKMIELVRALSVDPEILILDEITQSLSHNNRTCLYRLIEKFKEEGRAVLLISHDIEEVIEITDRIVVLRDGCLVGTLNSRETSPDAVKRCMVGREINSEYYRNDTAPSRLDTVCLKAEGLSVSGQFEPLDFELYAGEILGFCGLSDSGIHAVGKALYGITRDGRKGRVILPGEKVELSSATVALKNKVGYLPKERDHDCLMLKASIRDNFCLTDLDNFVGKLGYLSPRKLDDSVHSLVEHYQVRCQDIYQNIGSLSGGNKQKINLGRWMSKDLNVLILDCPTRGVDIGVKAYIYQLMREAKQSGLGIILISDELTEVLGMSDRILVMKNGRVEAQLDRGSDFTEEKVIEVMI